MTKAMMAVEAEKAELARMVLELDDMDPFFTNPANLEHFRRSVKQRENGEVVELTKEGWEELLGS